MVAVLKNRPVRGGVAGDRWGDPRSEGPLRPSRRAPPPFLHLHMPRGTGMSVAGVRGPGGGGGMSAA